MSSYPLAAANIVKSRFGKVSQMIYFLSSLFQVIYKSYRQVLTSSQMSRLLLKPGFLDKFRLAYNVKQHIQDHTRYN